MEFLNFKFSSINITNKYKIFFIFIICKILFTTFSLFVFHKFSPLVDAYLYQNEYYYETNMTDRTFFIQSIVTLLNLVMHPIASHFVFSILSVTGILWFILSRNENWTILLILLFPSAMVWTSVIGKESIYYLCFSTTLIIWSSYINNHLSNSKIIALIICTMICFFLRPHYAICIPWLFFVSYFLKNKKNYNLLFIITYSLLIFTIFIILFYGENINRYFDVGFFNFKWTALSSVDADARASRNISLGLEKLVSEYRKIPTELNKYKISNYYNNFFMTGFLFGIIGPFPSELISRPVFIPFFIEGCIILISPIIFIYILFKYKLLHFKNINYLNFIYGIVPAIFLLMFIHAFFGVLNPGTAIRWRVNFELIFYFAPFLLYLNILDNNKVD